MATFHHYDELPMDWVGDWAGRRAALTPERPAIFDAGSEQRFTYAQMNERANRAGAYLLDTLGLSKGDCIAYIGRNRVEPLDLYLACGKTGIILAPLSYRLAARELTDMLAAIQPQALFYDDSVEDLVAEVELPDSLRAQILISDHDCAYRSEVLRTPPRDVNVPLATSDPYLYVHTGGTTAAPKICVVPHRQMLWNSLEFLATTGGLSENRTLMTFPFFHIGGWNTITPIYHCGGYTVLLRKVEPGHMLSLIESEGITRFGAVEAVLQAVVDHPNFSRNDLRALKVVTTGGAPCLPRAMRPFWNRGITVSQSYGLTEAGPSNFIYTGQDHSHEEVWAHHKSIGKPMFHCDYRIVDQDSLKPVTRGDVGVLCLRSPHNFEGYLHDAARTKQIFMGEGWVYSGDLAREDERGYVYIVGRADNMFISGGENVWPEEIEEVLVSHPDLEQAVVVGVNDPKWGQAALALVVPREGASFDEESLTAYCRERLAAYKVPRRILSRKELPKTALGKLDRNAVKAQFS